MREKQNNQDRAQSHNQFDNSHSRIEEGRIREDYIELKITKDQLLRQIEDMKEKIKKLERKNEKLQGKVEGVKEQQIEKERLLIQYKELMKEQGPTSEQKMQIYNLNQENQKLKGELQETNEELDNLRAQMIKKKKTLLGEIENFINVKNTFEQSFHSELLKS